jgi:hypothetical protein
MADEILVKEQLTDKMIKAGKRLLHRLDSVSLEVVAAFWLYTSETNKWQLIIATPQVDIEGPRKLYGQIRQVLRDGPHKDSELDLLDITVFSPSEPLVRAIASIRNLTNDISGKRLTRSNLNGVYVEDIYIYFVKDSVNPLPGPSYYDGDKPL